MTAQLTIAELEQAGKLDLGAGSWIEVDQRRIDLFADATGDHQWIHVDPERASNGPFGTTVAHGYLSLSLIPSLLPELLSVTDARLGLNYGTERIRFTSPVPVGSEVRLRAKVASTERRDAGIVFRLAVEIEVRDQEKPALVGEVVYLAYE
jgi:acyl dehydratase